MGLRCLLSHEFGEPELEREREEQGNEVVITVNEIKTCNRCGERRTISENTEVTSMDQLTETASEPADEAADSQTAGSQQPSGTESPATTADASSGSVSDIGVTIDSSTSEADDAEVLTDNSADSADSADEAEDLGAASTAHMTVDDVEAAAAESTTAEPAEAVDAADDDGVILSDDSEADAETPVGRQPGEWPEYEAGDRPDAADRQWPNTDGDDEGFSAGEPSDETPEDMTFGGGFTPEITDSDMVDGDDDMELSFTRADETAVDYEPTVDDIPTEFYCPECGLSRLAGNSSMRAGDICPECKRGYIDERPT